MIKIFYGIRRFVFSLIVLLAFGLFPVFCCAESAGFSVSRVGQMVSHRSNIFSVTAPEAGLFTVTIHDDYHVYRIISCEVPCGTSQIEWDGCSYNLEKLNVQYYTFDFVLSGESGTEYVFSFRSPVVDNAQYLQFALPSSDTVYLSEPDEWFLEAKSILGGVLVLDFYSFGSDIPAVSLQKTLHQGRVEHFTFSQLYGKTIPEPGLYAVKAYEISRPDDAFTFPLLLSEKPAQTSEITLTGEIMPERSWSDAEIWSLMMKPSVVVDIDYQDHQPVYPEPEISKQILGTLHGQTQCLCVLEILDDWARIGAWNHEDARYVEGWVPLSKLKTVYPNTEYGMLLDKKNQTLTVFRKGERIETLLVSTGRMERDKYEQETSAGSFLTGLHRVDFSMQGNRYDFVIQYDGGNLLHQIPYSSDGKKDFTYGRAYLGSKASHACIRIQDFPGTVSGLNAYWLWTHIPYHTRLIILDDPEEREESLILISGSTPAFEMQNAARTDRVLPEDDNTITMTFAGDIVLSSRIETQWQDNSFKDYLGQYGSAYPFGALQELFGNDDLTCVNLSCVLRTEMSGRDYERRFVYRGLPEYSVIFPDGSVELVCLENNHIYDFGEAGLLDTIHALDGYADWISGNHTVCISLKGHLFGFAACSEARYLSDPFCIQQDISCLREEGCEYIVYQCDWTEESPGHHGILQDAMARACERYGADILIGHGPENVQGIGYINDMPVVWNLGKLIAVNGKTQDALIVQVSFHTDDPEKSPELRLVPVLTGFYAQTDSAQNRPSFARNDDKVRILTAVQSDSVCSVSELSSQ